MGLRRPDLSRYTIWRRLNYAQLLGLSGYGDFASRTG